MKRSIRIGFFTLILVISITLIIISLKNDWLQYKFKLGNIIAQSSTQDDWVVLETKKDDNVGGDIKVFQDYFKNVDYSNPNIFLRAGKQTEATPSIKKIAERINNNKDITTLAEIYKQVCYIKNVTEGEKFSLTADQILTRGLTGCTDYGLVFAALAREKGIPTVFLQTAKMDWINDRVNNRPQQNSIRGHILVEVFIEYKWYLVDSTAGWLYFNYDKDNLSLDDDYYVFAKSIEVFDTGIRNEQHNREVMFEQFKEFDEKKYIKPNYFRVNLGEISVSKNSRTQNTSVNSYFGVLLGHKDPVENFASRYNMSGANKSILADPKMFEENNKNYISKKDDVIVLFHIQGNYIPKIISDEISDIESSNNNVIAKDVDGVKYIVIYAANVRDLVYIISQLPLDLIQITTNNVVLK